MEGGRQHGALAHQHRHAVERRQDVDIGTHGHHHRCADEDRRQGRAFARTEHDLGLEGLHLAPVAVAADHRIEHAEGALVRSPVEHLARHQHEAGTGPQQRESRSPGRPWRPWRPRRAASASNRPVDSSSIESVVDSPPGSTRPATSSRSSGRFTRRVEQPTSARAARCSRTSPCRSSTPMSGPPLRPRPGTRNDHAEGPATTPGRRDARRTATRPGPASPHRGPATPWPRARHR